MPFLFAAFTSRLPADLGQEEVMLMAEGFEAYSGPEDIPREHMSYMVTLVSGDAELEDAHRSVSDTWRELYGFPIALERLEPRIDRFIRGLRRTARALGPGGVVLRCPVVGYCTGNDRIRGLCVINVRNALTRKPWQFWR